MKTILRFMKPYKGLCFFTLLVTILDVAGGLLIPRLTADMVNIGVAGGSLGYMLEKGGQMILTAFLAGAGALAGSYLCADLSAKIGRDMRNAVYDKSLKFSGEDFQKFGTGSMITRTLNDINVIQQAVVWCIQMVIPVPVVCIMGTSMAFAIDSQMGLLLIGVTVLIIVLALLVTRKASEIFDRLQRFLDRMNVVLRENITGVRVIRAFGREKQETENFSRANGELVKGQLFVGRISALMNPLTYSVVNIGIIAILWAGSRSVETGVLMSGDIVALVNYMSQILVELVKLANLIVTMSRAMASLGRVEQILDTKTVMEFPEKTTIREENTEEAVRFDHVSLSYAQAGEESLSDISFSVKKGETIGIIGGTGSGKSSLVHLIPRFYDATSGEIFLLGRSVKEWDRETLRQKVGIVMQKVQVFSGTIRSNLLMGNEGAGEEEMWQALRAAQAEEFVRKKSEGLDEPVEQGGRNLSGGQKQRLTIARALVRKPEILILDDSSSALDYATDAALRKALKNLPSNMTVFLVSQRTSSIRHADHILVLDDGKAAGWGTHEELLESCQIYREIYESQYGKGGNAV